MNGRRDTLIGCPRFEIVVTCSVENRIFLVWEASTPISLGDWKRHRPQRGLPQVVFYRES